jgi:hypothetical protein
MYKDSPHILLIYSYKIQFHRNISSWLRTDITMELNLYIYIYMRAKWQTGNAMPAPYPISPHVDRYDS